MKRPAYSAPEAFSLLPLLALLPVRGSVTKLHTLTTSLFARHENVQSVLKSLYGSGDIDREVLKRVTAEEGMLRHVLDWLEVNPKSIV